MSPEGRVTTHDGGLWCDQQIPPLRELVERAAPHDDALRAAYDAAVSALKEFRESLPTADYRFAVFDFQEQIDGTGWDDKICFFRWYVS